MKKIVCLLLAAVTAVSLAGCGKSNDNKLIVGTEAGFAPYEYMEGDKVVGIDMDIAQAIADSMGKELVIKNMDFQGALVAVQKGKVDLVAAGVSVDDERKKKMDFSHEYVNSTEVVVVNKDAATVTSAADLNDKIVGVQEGNIADFYVSNPDNVTPKDIKRYSKFVQAAEDLKNNKIDCIVMDQYPAKELVASNDSLVIIKKDDGTDDVLFEDKYAIAVKKGNQELLDKINKVIDQLIADGKIEEFTANHTKTSGQ
ncbi:transporter substrate-binding domain-containing protein [Anaerocolumna chitinilytica]|jgi:polar amino acid transport system substrate-binding protein|uniref:Basic amino acid ABC transporter substrate-binding protein n=1 Tax=Anaerocolumna chitinilytica TaxID=1727145 RepID=A0A7I8DTA5_9FIRM|nr:transporter substrate-binding domain-containing protein [Anaerocolumna chitinilytica]BCK00472.1 basic amino acid ABC transporter substrate-binding protein [Anaerocolumna chitinilytica]